MDPISAIFAAYLDMVSSSLPEDATDESGVQPKVIHVEHKGMKIPYTFRPWKIDPESVCNMYNSNINTYSDCAVAAKSLFSSACNYLEYNPSVLLNHRKQKDMYCNAAIRYEPAPVTVDWSEDSSPLSDARSECNIAIVGFMRNADLAARINREQACGKYDAIKAKRAKK